MIDMFTDPGTANMWTAVGAVAQGLAAILAIVALLYSISTFKSARKTEHYGELDKVYMELLRIALDRPHLVNAPAIRTATERAEYDIYAFMVWNFVEAIFDRCQEDKDLKATWRPVVETENRLHREWFDDPRNHHKFKPTFISYVQANWPRDEFCSPFLGPCRPSLW